MMFIAAKVGIPNHEHVPAPFLLEMVEWMRKAADVITAPNEVIGLNDIYNKVRPELGPYTSLLHRKAVMLEVMRILALFESDCDWTEGVDTSRLGPDTPDNAEAGAWQVSYDSRESDGALRAILQVYSITNGIRFQQTTKFNHPFAMEYVATLLRHNTKHNGPLFKGEERYAIRKKLRGEEHSVYPWLSRAAVAEFETLLS